MDEKLKELELIDLKLVKLQKKAYKLIGRLNATEEYNTNSSSTDYAERDLLTFVKWMRWEIDRQRKHVLQKED